LELSTLLGLIVNKIMSVLRHYQYGLINLNFEFESPFVLFEFQIVRFVATLASMK
jgi:hypothetical protein